MAEPLKLKRPPPRPGEVPSASVITEDSLAQQFVELHGPEYRSVPGWGVMHYVGTHWARDVALCHFDEVRKLCRQAGIDDLCEKADTKRLGLSRTVAGVAQFVRADQRIVATPEEFDSDRSALNTPAGIVNLRDASMRPTAHEYVTKLTAVSPDFVTKPKKWMRFMGDVFQGDEEKIEFVHRLLGYALTGETREQVVTILHGGGANGKSTLLDVVTSIAGSYAIKVPSSTLMAQRGDRHPTDIAQLRGVRLAVANEVNEGEHWDESRLKELSGDAKLTARFMRQDYFQFDATGKFIIAANHRPQMRSMDDAMRRRLVLVPFNAKFEGDRRDPDMLEKLKAEGGAILAWLIAGAVEWYESGLQVPDAVRAASEEYADTMDSLGLWLADCCLLSGDRGDFEPAGRLYRSYSDWKERLGERPVSHTRWGEQMRGHGVERYRSDGIKYRGIRLTPEEDVRVAAALAPRA